MPLRNSLQRHEKRVLETFLMTRNVISGNLWCLLYSLRYHITFPAIRSTFLPIAMFVCSLLIHICPITIFLCLFASTHVVFVVLLVVLVRSFVCPLAVLAVLFVSFFTTDLWFFLIFSLIAIKTLLLKLSGFLQWSSHENWY